MAIKIKTKTKIILILSAFVAIMAIMTGIIVGGQVKSMLASAEVPVSEPPIIVINDLTEIDKAEILRNKAIEIRKAVIGESRQRKELLVLERDVQVESVLESTWAGLDIFKKAKRIVSFGTGYYNVDLSGIGEDSIKIDHEKKLVTITVPHSVLKSISIDEGKTQYEDTQKGLLGFGELKLTMEQQGILKESVEKSMHDQLEASEMFEEADTAGRLMVKEIYMPLVTAVLDDYSVEVQMPD